jgi:hypothetical protein
VTAVGLFFVWAAPALGAEPAPSAAAGDPRSSGEGPGLVGEPLLAIGIVLAIALVAVVATMTWVRLTAGRREPDATPRR